MQITPTNTLTAEAAADTSNRVVQKQLGQDDFLKLLTVQLQQQDPLKPMDDMQQIAQMAQFSSLQQMSALNDSLQAMRSDSQLASAGTLIGREATFRKSDGTSVTGVVESVEQTEGGPKLSINGTAFDYGALVRVAAAPATTPAA